MIEAQINIPTVFGFAEFGISVILHKFNFKRSLKT
jgi:hypothetical protein